MFKRLTRSFEFLAEAVLGKTPVAENVSGVYPGALNDAWLFDDERYHQGCDVSSAYSVENVKGKGENHQLDRLNASLKKLKISLKGIQDVAGTGQLSDQAGDHDQSAMAAFSGNAVKIAGVMPGVSDPVVRDFLFSDSQTSEKLHGDLLEIDMKPNPLLPVWRADKSQARKNSGKVQSILPGG